MSNIKPLATRMYEITCTKENSFLRKVLYLYQPLISNASWSDVLISHSCLIRVMSDLWPVHFLTCPFSDLSIRWPVHLLTCPFADLYMSYPWPVWSVITCCSIFISSVYPVCLCFLRLLILKLVRKYKMQITNFNYILIKSCMITVNSKVKIKILIKRKLSFLNCEFIWFNPINWHINNSARIDMTVYFITTNL